MRSDRSLWCWGWSLRGQRGDGSEDEVRTTPARVVQSGASEGGPAWTDWDAFAVGDYHTCGLRDGGVWCWGWNAYGQRGNAVGGLELTPSRVVQAGASAGGATWDDWTAVSAGGFTTCGLREGGDAWCWGSGEHGRLGDGTVTSEQYTPSEVVAP